MPVSGTVSCWNEEKGFGFIVEFGTQESIYVHRSGLIDEPSLHVGDEVEFERSQDAADIKRGKERATEVRVTKQNSNGNLDETGLDDNAQLDALDLSREGKPYVDGIAEDRPYGFDDDLPGAEDRPYDPEDIMDGAEDRPYDPEEGMDGGEDKDKPFEFDDNPDDAEDRPYEFDGADGAEDRREGSPDAPREVGRVKSWYDDKKFGFIIPDSGGDSIYVHCTGLLGMEFLREGDVVEFERFQDSHDKKRGKERAANVRLLEDGNEGQEGREGREDRNFGRHDRFRGQDFPTPPMPPAPPQAGGYGRWNDDRGFGPRRPYYEEEGRYVPRMAPIGCDPSWEGEDVGYERDGRDMDYGRDRARTSSSSSSGLGYVRDGGRGYGRSWRGRDDYDNYGYDYRYPHHYPRGSRYGGVPEPPPASFPRTEVGTVMSWKDDKGFGFILLHGSKESIYCHRTGLQGVTALREGDAVEFERTQSQRDADRGKDRATNVRLYTGHFDDGPSHFRSYPYRAPPPARDDYPSYERGSYHREGYGYNTSYANRGYGAGYDIGSSSSWNDERGYNTSYANKGPAVGYEIGTVSAWHDDKGFGFIISEDTQESVYVHRTGLLTVSGLREGDTVEFGRTQDARDVERGKDRAVNVRILGGGRGRDRSRSPRHRYPE